MIYYFTPYINGNLGQAYNHYCNLVPNDDDWITMMDGDVMQLHTNWAEIWENIINNSPKTTGIVTCQTNRIGCWTQRLDYATNIVDILEHKKIALELYDKYNINLTNITHKCMSGFYFSFKKSLWKSVDGFSDGILDVDQDFFLKASAISECYLAKGFYVLHYYRLYEGKNSISHLIKD